MALSRTISTDWGITVSGSYCRVEAVSLTSKDRISFHARSYTASEGVPFFAETRVDCPYEINGENPIKQAYEHLKSLPEFADAVDC